MVDLEILGFKCQKVVQFAIDLGQILPRKEITYLQRQV